MFPSWFIRLKSAILLIWGWTPISDIVYILSFFNIEIILTILKKEIVLMWAWEIDTKMPMHFEIRLPQIQMSQNELEYV